MMMKEPTWGVKAAYGRVTPHLGSLLILFLVSAVISGEMWIVRYKAL